MKNKLLISSILVLLCLLVYSSVFADENEGYVFDSTGRFSDAEIASYNDKARKIINDYDVAVYFVVINDAGDKSEVQYTEDFYEEHAAGANCLIMMLTDKTYYVLPIGIAVDVFEYREEYLYDAFYKEIYAGNTYSDGALSYLDEVIAEMDEYNNDKAIEEASKDEKSGTRIVDNSDVFESIFENTISMKLDEISIRYQCDVLFIVVPSTYKQKLESFADEYFEYNSYGIEGNAVLLLMDTDKHDFCIRSYGDLTETIFNSDVLSYIENEVGTYLKQKNYEKGLQVYTNLCEEYLIDGKNGVIYTKDTLPNISESTPISTILIVVLIIMALTVTAVLILKKYKKTK